MKLKHMAVQYTHVPETETTFYYAFGIQDGTMYESTFELSDATFRLLNAFQIDETVTAGLEANIVEVTTDEIERRRNEMEGLVRT